MNPTSSGGYGISVIIPAYNTGKYIGRAIRSVLAQEYAPYEIIVVDDGSTDETAKVAKSFDVTYLYKPNGGAASARNAGLRRARGEWVAFLDSDDCWRPNHLRVLMSLVQKHDLNWCAGAFQSGQDGTTGAFKSPKSRSNGSVNGGCFENFFQALAGGQCSISADTVIVEKTLMSRAGAFEESFEVGEDLDMWFRIAHLNPGIGYSSEPTAEYHLRSGSLMADRRGHARTILTLLDKHYALAENYGCGHLARFMPAAAMLARMVFKNGVIEEDRWVMARLAARYRHLLGWRRYLASLIATTPGFAQGCNRLIRMGARMKSMFRQKIDE